MKSPTDYIRDFAPWYKHHPYLAAAVVVGTAALLVATALASLPRKQAPALSTAEQARLDSAALHVALMPVQDCLPFYVAQRAGIYDQLGLDVRIQTLQAQLDTDTALLRQRVELAYSDLARAIMLQQTGRFDLRAVASAGGTHDLVTARRGRVRKLNGLKERMVAVARHSITDYWSDRLTDTAGLAQADIFRPQINDVRIRTDMLCNGTLDAAFLPQPYAQEALLRGNVRNFTTAGLTPRLGAFVVPAWVVRDSSRLAQLRLFFEGYARAIQLTDSLPPLLRSLCQTPDSLADTIARALPPATPLRRVELADAEAALRWLRSRDVVRKDYSTDSLIFDLHGLESLQ